MLIKREDTVTCTRGEGSPYRFVLSNWETSSNSGSVIKGMRSAEEDYSIRINVFKVIDHLSEFDKLQILKYLHFINVKGE